MDLKDIFERKLNQLGIKKQVTASQVCAAYDKAVLEVFGENALENTEAISFKNGVLKVRVSSSAWGQEVQGGNDGILEKLEQFNVKRITYELY